MSTGANSAGAIAAEGAERRWAWVVAAIIVILVGMMVFTGPKLSARMRL